MLYYVKDNHVTARIAFVLIWLVIYFLFTHAFWEDGLVEHRYAILQLAFPSSVNPHLVFRNTAGSYVQ